MPTAVNIRLAEQSLQFSDNPAQVRSDCSKIFSRGDHIIFGTEAGAGGTVRPILLEEAKKADYRCHVRGDTWVAVMNSIIAGNYEVHDVFVMSSGEGFGHHSNRYVTGVKFDSIWENTKIAASAGHYLTRGRVPSEPNFDLNVLYAEKLLEWTAWAKDCDIVLYGGDQNIVDKNRDTFLGKAPYTSCWDALNKYPGTGHGNIDVIALLDRCKARFEWVSATVLDDSELPLFTDHFHVQVKALIKPKVVEQVVIKPASPPVVPAHSSNYGDRENHPIKWNVIHSTVSPCVPGGARNIARLIDQNHPNQGKSWQYVIDPAEVIQCVGDSFVAWHCGFNTHSLAYEMCDVPGPVPDDKPGSAAWKAAKRAWRWSRPNQIKMLNRTARLVARNSLAYDIPMRFVGVKGLLAGKRGITTHACMSKAFKKSTHWDPGFWPKRTFVLLVRAHAVRIKRRAAKNA